MSFEEYVIKNNLGTIENGVRFAELTTIGCGGKIRTLYTPKNLEALLQAFQYIEEHELSFFLLGNGSNVLASDREYTGIVIQLKKLLIFPWSFLCKYHWRAKFYMYKNCNTQIKRPKNN